MTTERSSSNSCSATRTLLSVVFVLLSSALLPGPCIAAPQGYRIREPRSAAPDPRCPTCSRDCPESLSGGPLPPVPEGYPPALARSQYLPPPIPYSPPSPPQSYNPPPPLPPSLQSYNSPPPVPPSPLSYELPPPSPSAYDAAPPPPPPPQVELPCFARPPPPPPLPLASLEQPCFGRPPPPPPPPAEPPCLGSRPPTEPPCLSNRPPPPLPQPPFRYNLLGSPSPVSRYNSPLGSSSSSDSWSSSNSYPSPSNFRNLNYDPLGPPEYPQPRFYNNHRNGGGGCGSDCGCGGRFDPEEEDDDEVIFSKYNRRSSEAAPRFSRHYQHSGHHQDHYVRHADRLDSPASMYRTYRPYNAGDDRGIYPRASDEYPSDERSRGRERLYVVYRADAIDEPSDTASSSSSTGGKSSPVDQPMSDRELEAVIRRAIDIARQQRVQENALRERSNSRYRYDHYVEPQQDPQDQDRTAASEDDEDDDDVDGDDTQTSTQFVSLDQQQQQQQQMGKQGNRYQAQNQGYVVSPGKLMDAEGGYVVRANGVDEANNPGWDQSKWTPVPAAAPPGNVEFIDDFKTAARQEAVEEDEDDESNAKRESRGEDVSAEIVTVKTTAAAAKTETDATGTRADLIIEDMVQPPARVAVTEASSFEKQPETSTNRK